MGAGLLGAARSAHSIILNFGTFYRLISSVPENARILRAPAFRPARKTGGLRKKNWGFACEARKKR